MQQLDVAPAATAVIPYGTRVRVSDGRPRPPERFTRKLADWKFTNFTGVVLEYLAADGHYRIVKDSPNSGYLQIHAVVRQEFVHAFVPDSRITSAPVDQTVSA